MTYVRDSGGGNGNRTPKPRKRLPARTPEPHGDTKSSADLHRGDKTKKTPAYRGAIRQAYSSKPPAQREARASTARVHASQGKATPEDKVILRLHGARTAAHSGMALPSPKRFELHAPEIAAKLLAVSRTGRPIYSHEGAVPNGVKNYLRAGDVTAGEIIGGLAGSAAALGAAAYHDPIGVPVKTGKQLVRALPAIPGGVYDLATHPAKTVGEQAKGFEERSGDQSISEKVKNIRKEGGLAYVGDLATVIPGGGAASKLVLRATKKGAKAERAAVRLSGGTVQVKRDRGLYAEAIGNVDAKRRAAKAEKALTAAEAGGKPVDAVTRQVAEVNRKAGKVVEVPGRFRGPRQRRLVAKDRGRAIYGLKSDQGRRVKATRKVLAGLNKKERRAFYYATAFGLRTPEHAKLLEHLPTKIREARAADGIQVTGSLKKSDMVPDIEAILRDPAGHLTPKLAAAVETLREDSHRAAAEDPSLTHDQVLIRRHAPLADLLGMERGVIRRANAANGAPIQLSDAARKSIARNQRKGLAKPPPRIRVSADDAFSTRDIPVEKTGGAPHLPADQIQWFHGTPHDFKGLPTAEGRWSDLGVYLTSDPYYAKGYSVREGGDFGHMVPVRVQPKNVLDMRGGHHDPAAMRAIIQNLRNRVEEGIARELDNDRMASKDPRQRARREATMRENYSGLLEKWERHFASGDPLTVVQSQRLLEDLNHVSENVGRMLGKVGSGQRHQLLAEAIRAAGFDAVRKVDQSADALVVLDESIMRRVTGTEGTPSKYALPTAPELRYHPDETAAEFAGRVGHEAKHSGLASPLYFKSERYIGPRDFAAYAVGGKRAMSEDQRYGGVNLKHGLQDTSPDQYIRGLARNIKRKHNWGLVSDLLEHNAVREFSPSPEGTTVSALRERLAQSGVDMQSVALWNPGAYRSMAHADDAEHFGRAEELDQAQVSTALKGSLVRVNRAGQAVDGFGRQIPEEMLLKSSGWHVVPDAVVKELDAQMVPSGKTGRVLDIAKGKASRAILLTGNLPWLGFQVASNVAMGTAASGGRLLNPANWVHAWRGWHDLTPEQRDRVGAMLGLDATGADSHQVKLGAASSNDFVNAYRAFKEHPFWHAPVTTPVSGALPGRLKRSGPSISQLNPLELMAKADRTQNNIFRVAAGYTKLKRDAVRQMGENMGHADRAQLKIMSIFQKPPRDQLRAIADDPGLMEEHAHAINDWMGDYTTMTAAERKVVNRMVMFMPYLRYSLRLLFWTMPVDHPIMSGVLAELGQMKADELAKLFGEDALPWNSGKLYFGSGGNLKSIDLKRANPALSAVIDAVGHHSLSQLVGVMPPYVGWLYDQIAEESGFKGKDWALQGHAAEYGGPHLGMGHIDLRSRILLSDAMQLMYPTRVAQNLEFNPATLSHDKRLGGPQGDDSLIFSPRPTYFKGNTTVGKLQAKFGKRRERFDEAHTSLISELIPLLPQADRSKAEAREAAIIKRAESKPKNGPKGYRFGGAPRKQKAYRFR